MNLGTRVTHRRYQWVGHVVGTPVLGVRTVLWDNHWGHTRDEYESDLRATPAQTFPVTYDLTCPCSECTCGLPPLTTPDERL